MSRFFTYPNPANTLSVPVAINQGGTGQVTANAGLNALLPTQTAQSGKFLTTDGTNTSWATAGGGGITWATPVNSDIIPDGDGTRSIGAANSYMDFVYAYNSTVLETDYINSDGTQQYATFIANNDSADINISSLNENTSGNTVGLQLRTENNGSGNSKHILIKTGTASGTRGKLKLQDGSEGTSGYVWTSTDTVGTGHWAAAGGGGFTGDVHVGSTCTSQSSLITSTTFANYSNSPTLTFTPASTGTYRVSAECQIYDTTAADSSQCQIACTAGGASPTYTQTGVFSPNAATAGGQFPAAPFIIITLTGGVSYSFDIQGATGAGTANNYLMGNVQSFAIVAVRIA